MTVDLMYLEPSETQVMLRDTLRRLLDHEMSLERVHRTQRDGDDPALWSRLAADGWTALALGSGVDGADAALLDVALAVEEVAKSAAVIPFMETMASCDAVSSAGTPGALDVVASGIRTGDVRIAPAVANHGAVPLHAARSRVWGVASFVDYGDVCSHHLVEATDRGAPGLYLVDTRDPGVRTESLRNIGRTPQARVTYDDAAALRVGGPAALRRLRQVGIALCAVQLVGYAQAAFDLTVHHVRERHQFGKPIGAFQAVQHQCADMATQLAATRFLVDEAIAKTDRNEIADAELAMAKAAASRTSVFVTVRAHQLHGGIGVTEEYPLQFLSRRAKQRAVAWQSQHEALAVVAQSVDQPAQWI